MGAAGLDHCNEGGTDHVAIDLGARDLLGVTGDDERARRLRPLVEQLHSVDAEDFLWVVLTLIKERGGTPPLITSTGVPAQPITDYTAKACCAAGATAWPDPCIWHGQGQPAPRDADGDERGAGNHTPST